MHIIEIIITRTSIKGKKSVVHVPREKKR